ncbi:hypothetical protein BDQ94DRAFT_87577 [Aspergillus welwitschiae]|uniref:Uncharacterized protein n=1 Tax=Aspergillus welwitschiae TaxID=1341132 RepID=A0A3F3PQQ5_9EURO|nr:hypothetical protein BDQ94DRAFT_87577 [Aspergillus welwitschiae]RDH29148.1 hypothetical protein BDQ94DRAFT_87577 [Aspergillus welwitschiae]
MLPRVVISGSERKIRCKEIKAVMKAHRRTPPGRTKTEHELRQNIFWRFRLPPGTYSPMENVEKEINNPSCNPFYRRPAASNIDW